MLLVYRGVKTYYNSIIYITDASALGNVDTLFLHDIDDEEETHIR